MKKAKQTLSLLLVLIFLLGLLPGAALAGGDPAASVTLNKRTLQLTVGGTETLHATVEPKNHTDTVYWVSDDTNVVTVSDGLVTAVGAGSAHVTAAAGAFSDTCTVTVNAAKNTLNFSTNLNAEYTTSSGSPFRLSVAVGSYTPAGGEATPLPAGTAITYQWYKSTDEQIDASDSKVYPTARMQLSWVQVFSGHSDDFMGNIKKWRNTGKRCAGEMFRYLNGDARIFQKREILLIFAVSEENPEK